MKRLRRFLPVGGLALVLVGAVTVSCGPAATATPTPTTPAQPTATATPAPGQTPVATPTTAPGETPTPTIPAAGEPQYGGTLKNAHRRYPPGLDPHAFTTGDLIGTVGPGYNSLLQLMHPDYVDVGADLAKSWEWGSDAKSITLVIHEGVQDHAGNPLTASDIKFVLERLAFSEDLQVGGAYETDIESVEVVNDTTVKINLFAPNAVFLRKLGDPRAAIFTEAAFNSVDIDRTILGTGPYIVDQIVPGERVTYKKNPNYFKPGQPYFDGVDITIITDSNTRLATLEAGQIDLLNVANADGIGLDAWAGAKARHPNDIEYRRGIHFGNRSIYFNAERDGPWQKLGVRQAIHYALDRGLALEVLPAFGTGAYWPPTDNWGIPQAELAKRPGYRTGPDKELDRQMAREALAAAGYPNGLTLDAITRDIEDYGLYTAPYVIEQLARVGITLNVEIMESARYLERDTSGDFGMNLGTPAAGSMDDPEFFAQGFLCGNPRNLANYCNEEFDRVMAQSRSETDIEKRRQLTRQAEEILLEDLFFIPIWWQGRHPGWRTWVLNPPVQDRSGQYTQAYRAEDYWFDRSRR